MTYTPAPPRERILQSVVIALGFGGGVLMLAWHADTFRLSPNGTNLAWPVLVAFAVAWRARSASAWRPAVGLIAGSLLGTLGFYAALKLLPVTPLGVGIGLGVTALVLAVVALALPDVVPFDAAAAGLAVGVASSQLTDLGPTTGFGDVVAVLTANALALLLGVLGAVALHIIASLTRRPAEADETPTEVIDLARAKRAS